MERYLLQGRDRRYLGHVWRTGAGVLRMYWERNRSFAATYTVEEARRVAGLLRGEGTGVVVVDTLGEAA